jgi:putative hydrolase of the HAD superfamily
VTATSPGDQALIVDFGGVLTSPLVGSMESFAREMGIELSDLVRVALSPYAGGEDSLVTDFETGRIGEREFSADLARRLEAIAARPVDPEGLVQRLFLWELQETMIEAVATVRRAGVKTGLLSNSWGTSLYPEARLAELFDDVVLSGVVGLRKPDPAIFRLAAKRLGVRPERCVFVDDHPGHLEAARREGMVGVLHMTPAATIAELERLLSLRLS